MSDMKYIYFPKSTADEEIRAILDNRKTATRRVVKQLCGVKIPLSLQLFVSPHSGMVYYDGADRQLLIGEKPVVAPYRPGDILYVRETWAKVGDNAYGYKADDVWIVPRWRPSIHMPREAARIFLRVTAVRVERLQDITEEQAQAEGLYKGWTLTERSTPACTARQAFMWVWDMTIKPADRALYGWAANPWVWVIEFERIRKEEEIE